MPNPYFRFKQFTVHHDRCAMKVTTDSCLFGAWAANEVQQSSFPIKTVLDIGGGTGLLSLMIAQKNDLEIDVVEIDREATGQAAENIASSPWAGEIKVFNQDILSFQSDKSYDCIICNPPFYENELASSEMQKNIAHHSEELRLEEVISLASEYLKGEGLFFLLLPYKRIKDVDAFLDRNNFYQLKKIVVKQSTKHGPFRVLIMASKKNNGHAVIEEMDIRNDQQQYTEEFTSLLKDYYLYL